jgi:cytochrome c-type biogenesis protein CcsB
MNTSFFSLALPFYLASTTLYEVYLVIRAEWARRWGSRLLTVAVLLHAVALLLRWREAGHLPLSNLFETLSAYAFLLAVVYLIVEWRSGRKVVGAFVSPLVFLLFFAAATLPKNIDRLEPELHSPWLGVHVGLFFMAYTFMALAFASAVVYLLQERGLRLRRPGAWYYRLPPLTKMDNLSYNLAAIGFPLMTLAILTGSLWAKQAWGAFWVLDPKLNLALLTWLIYVLYFFLRHSMGWRGRRAAWVLVMGFIAVIITYFGTAITAPGPHNFLRKT